MNQLKTKTVIKLSFTPRNYFFHLMIKPVQKIPLIQVQLQPISSGPTKHLMKSASSHINSSKTNDKVINSRVLMEILAIALSKYFPLYQNSIKH